MAKKFAKYTLPRLEEDLDTLANSVLTYATPHIEGVSVPSTGSGTGGALAVGVVRQAVGELVEPHQPLYVVFPCGYVVKSHGRIVRPHGNNLKPHRRAVQKGE
jgi:hypothetical protein